MKMKKLTDAQIDRFPQYMERWLKIGLSTEPLDRDAASAAIDEVYVCAGKKPPEIKIFLNSPLAGAVGAAFLKELKISGNQVWNQVRNQVWEQVGDQVWNQVRNQVWEQVGEQVGDQVRNQVNKAGYGSHDAGWLAFYDFFKTETNLECCKKITGLINAAMNCGWFWPFENAVIITERPRKITLDDQKRLHCENGLAIEYPDGWGVSVWRGVHIPEKWVKGEKPTAKEAITWKNMEQRRAACEIVGWECILKELKATTINKDDDPEIGELLECTIPDIGKEKFLRVRCGTGRDFALPVPPEMQTALDAQAWLNFCTTDDILGIEFRT